MAAMNAGGEALAARRRRRCVHGMSNQEGDNTTVAKRLLTVDEAAFYIGRTANAMRHLIAEGVIPIVRIGRKRIFIDIRDLDKIIEESKLTFD